MIPTVVRSRCWPETIRGVALDMDGLLFDTEPLYCQVCVNVLGRRGHPFEDTLRREMMGRPGPVAVQLMIDHAGLNDTWEPLLRECDGEFMRLAEQGFQSMPGLEALIGALEAKRIPFGVATSSRRALADYLLGEAGLRDKLHFLLTGDDITHGKPHPEIYQRSAAALNIPTNQMLVLEDSGNGCRAGVASGACTIAVPGEHSQDHSFDGVSLVADRLDDPRILQLI